MFEDRRGKPDRRRKRRPEAIPADGCRRRTERRCVTSQYRPGPWWLKTNYAEEILLTPPSAVDGNPKEPDL